MNPIILAILLGGPWRTLAPLESPNDLRPVVESLDAILYDKWLDLPANRVETCDSPCAVVEAAPRLEIVDRTLPSLQCQEVQGMVAHARESWLDARAKGFRLGEDLNRLWGSDDPALWSSARRSYDVFLAAMIRTRQILPRQHLIPAVKLHYEWRLQHGDVLPGIPAEWPKTGAGFTASLQTGRILQSNGPLSFQVANDAAGLAVRTSLVVSSTELCASDANFRVEGVAAFMATLPLSTYVALTTRPGNPGTPHKVTLPGDL